MYQIRTESGTIYEIRDGRITREGDSPVLAYRDLRPDPRAVTIVNEPFVLVTPAEQGERFQFRIKRTGGLITTSPVQSIERYCKGHDMFGCWLCCPPVRSLTQANA